MISNTTNVLPLQRCCNCGQEIGPDVKPMRTHDTPSEVDRDCPALGKCVSSRVWVTRHVAIQFDVETYEGPEALVLKSKMPTAEALEVAQCYMVDHGYVADYDDRDWMRGLPLFVLDGEVLTGTLGWI